MTKQQFLESFRNALEAENVPNDFIDEQSSLIEGKIETLSDGDFAKSASEENVRMLVRSAMDEFLSRTRLTFDLPVTPDESDETVTKATEAADTTDTAEPEVTDNTENSEENAENEQNEDIAVNSEIAVNDNTGDTDGTDESEAIDKGEETVVLNTSTGTDTDDNTTDTDSAPTIAVDATKKIDTVADGDETEENISEENTSEVGTSDKTDDDVVTVDMTPIVPHKKKGEGEANAFWKKIVKKAESRTPTLLFTILTVLLFPLILFTAFVVLALVFSVYFGLAALAIALVVGIIAVICGGGLTSLVALLYGATQIMQTPRYVGIHEIGFALILIGSTILISILLYNLAIKFIPWVLSKASVLFKDLVVWVKRLAEKARKGCDKL